MLTLAVRSRCDRGDVRKPMNSRMLRPANRFLLTLLTLLFLTSWQGGGGTVPVSKLQGQGEVDRKQTRHASPCAGKAAQFAAECDAIANCRFSEKFVNVTTQTQHRRPPRRGRRGSTGIDPRV